MEYNQKKMNCLISLLNSLMKNFKFSKCQSDIPVLLQIPILTNKMTMQE